MSRAGLTPRTVHREEILASVEQLVSYESPSHDSSAVRESAQLLAALGERILGVRAELITGGPSTHVLWHLGQGPRRVLLLGHHDTVWPRGTLSRIPFAVSNGIIRGPGCFDMKAGIAMMLHAMAAIPAIDGATILVTGDEETGSHHSRDLIEREALLHESVLVLEASADGGSLKTARKGVSQYSVATHGRASHAGLSPSEGINATVEAAHQVLRISALADAVNDTTVTPTLITGGTTGNTVPALATLEVDVRAWTASEQLRVDRELLALQPVLPGASLEISGGVNRLPMEEKASRKLFAVASDIALDLGLAPLASASVGGASDGNITAALGVPTLDGLGAVGGGAHSEEEYVVANELAPRTALLAFLIAELVKPKWVTHEHQ